MKHNYFICINNIINQEMNNPSFINIIISIIVTAVTARQRQDNNSRIENLKLKREEGLREAQLYIHKVGQDCLIRHSGLARDDLACPCEWLVRYIHYF